MRAHADMWPLSNSLKTQLTPAIPSTFPAIPAILWLSISDVNDQVRSPAKRRASVWMDEPESSSPGAEIGAYEMTYKSASLQQPLTLLVEKQRMLLIPHKNTWRRQTILSLHPWLSLPQYNTTEQLFTDVNIHPALSVHTADRVPGSIIVANISNLSWARNCSK